MSSFTRAPQLTRIEPQRWRVENGFEYHVGRIGSGFVVLRRANDFNNKKVGE